MPKTPDKCGITSWLAVNVETQYSLNVIPCLGKYETPGPSHRFTGWVVMNPMESYLVKGRNVTTDDFFTLYGLAKQLR